MKNSKAKLRLIMTTAWKIAKKSANKYGGRSVEFLSQALIIVWKRAKMHSENSKRALAKKIHHLRSEVNAMTFQYSNMPQAIKKLQHGRKFLAEYKEKANNLNHLLIEYKGL